MRQIKPSVVDEEMEGELLAIDDTTGKYFAVRGTGLWLWSVLRSGVDLAQLIASLDPTVAADVDAFVTRLDAAGLLIDAPAAASVDAASTADLEPPVPWSPPEFEVHDDLQDLLLLDPIHEVTDAGWPNIGAAG